MTYGEVHGDTDYGEGDVGLGDPEFFEQVDRRLFDWNRPLHDHRPFGRLFPYDEVGTGGKVLEVGCGMGTMAMCWARAGASVTAVDLNPTAVEQTSRRFELMELDGDIRQADGRELPFEDDTFDFAYSWGVLDKSPELQHSLAELVRVVRPGGRYGFYLYHRNSFQQWYMTEYVEGFLHLERRFLGPLALASRYGDAAREEGNPFTWPVTRDEVVEMLDPYSSEIDVRVLGTDIDGILATIMPGLDRAVPAWMKKPWARRFGWSIWFEGRAR